jgi:hypothetical protein
MFYTIQTHRFRYSYLSVFLNLAGNKLTGTIPSEVGDLFLLSTYLNAPIDTAAALS